MAKEPIQQKEMNDGNVKFKRGDKIVDWGGLKGVILGKEDFEGYEYNRPSSKWELVQWDIPDYKPVWSGSIWFNKKETILQRIKRLFSFIKH
jgi:hypothetical protein